MPALVEVYKGFSLHFNTLLLKILPRNNEELDNAVKKKFLLTSQALNFFASLLQGFQLNMRREKSNKLWKRWEHTFTTLFRTFSVEIGLVTCSFTYIMNRIKKDAFLLPQF